MSEELYLEELGRFMIYEEKNDECSRPCNGGGVGWPEP